jgi:hypothetical protein
VNRPLTDGYPLGTDLDDNGFVGFDAVVLSFAVSLQRNLHKKAIILNIERAKGRINMARTVRDPSSPNRMDLQWSGICFSDNFPYIFGTLTNAQQVFIGQDPSDR